MHPDYESSACAGGTRLMQNCAKFFETFLYRAQDSGRRQIEDRRRYLATIGTDGAPPASLLSSAQISFAASQSLRGGNFRA